VLIYNLIVNTDCKMNRTSEEKQQANENRSFRRYEEKRLKRRRVDDISFNVPSHLSGPTVITVDRQNIYDNSFTRTTTYRDDDFIPRTDQFSRSRNYYNHSQQNTRNTRPDNFRNTSDMNTNNYYPQINNNRYRNNVNTNWRNDFSNNNQRDRRSPIYYRNPTAPTTPSNAQYSSENSSHSFGSRLNRNSTNQFPTLYRPPRTNTQSHNPPISTTPENLIPTNIPQLSVSPKKFYYAIIDGPKDGIHHTTWDDIKAFQRTWHWVKKFNTFEEAQLERNRECLSRTVTVGSSIQSDPLTDLTIKDNSNMTLNL